MQAPLAGACAVDDVGAPDFVDRLAVVGNPQFGRIAAGDPKVVVAGDGRRQVAADALAVVVPVVGDALQGAQPVGEGGRRAERDVGNVGAGDVVPDFAHNGAACVNDLEV